MVEDCSVRTMKRSYSRSSVVQPNALSNVVIRSTANEGRSKGRQDAGDIRSAVGGSGARGMRMVGDGEGEKRRARTDDRFCPRCVPEHPGRVQLRI